MKKICVTIITIIVGFFIPDIVSSLRDYISDLQNDIVVEDVDEIRKGFYMNPSINIVDSLWCSIPYQAERLPAYDLFPYTWYVAFQYDDYSSRYTIHRMLSDTILDENHYIPNSLMEEFAQKIMSIKIQTEK